LFVYINNKQGFVLCFSLFLSGEIGVDNAFIFT